MQHEESLKKVRFTLHPIMLDSVKSSLKKLGFSNITITDIKHYDSKKSSHETYRGSNYEIQAKKMARNNDCSEKKRGRFHSKYA